MGSIRAGYGLSITWLWAGYRLAIGWPLSGHCLALGWLVAGYGVFMGWLWVIGWLWAGYWLAMAPNQYTSRHSHILLHVCTNVTNGCKQYFRLMCSQDFWLSAGCGPKSIHFKTVIYTTMYQHWKWLQSILLTVVCSQDFLAISWLSAGYWLAMS